MKCEVLYFDSHHVCSLKRRKIKDGKIIFDKKSSFDIDKVKPLLIESTWLQFGGMAMFPMIKKTYPLFVCKHNKATPIDMTIHKDKPGIRHYTPKNLTSLSKSATINTLLTLKPPPGQMIMWLIIGGVIGFLANYFIMGMQGMM